VTISESAVSARTITNSVRALTDEECAFYYEHGWAMLPGLISEESAEMLFVEAKSIMGPRATNTNRGQVSKDDPARPVRALEMPSELSELFKGMSYSRRLGQAAALLMSSPLFGPRQARYLHDSLLVKMPDDEGGIDTQWHQDQGYYPFDRDGSVGIWTALAPMTPDMGTLRFIDGSHRLAHFGHFPPMDLPVDALARYPGIVEQCTMTPVLELRAGDTFVFDASTLHGAGPNLTDRPRWALRVSFFPAEARYTGQPYRYCDNLGLAFHEPLDHPNFPIFGDS
jgi:hypothetical protein